VQVAPITVLIVPLMAALLAACAKQAVVPSRSENQTQFKPHERVSVPAFVPPGAFHLLNENNPESADARWRAEELSARFSNPDPPRDTPVAPSQPNGQQFVIQRPAPIPRPAATE